jgi:hypothetical protein
VLRVEGHHFRQGPRGANVDVADKDVGGGGGAEDRVADCGMSVVVYQNG